MTTDREYTIKLQGNYSELARLLDTERARTAELTNKMALANEKIGLALDLLTRWTGQRLDDRHTVQAAIKTLTAAWDATQDAQE